MRREHDALESFRSLHENNARLAKEEVRKINEANEAKANFMNNYYINKDIKARKEAEHANLLEAARNDGLAIALKAIYITALEAEAMTDNGILLAESMVDGWITEQGGASKILNSRVANKTYLLSRLTQIVEDYAITAVNEIESDEEDTEEEVKEAEDDKKKEDSSKNIEDIKKFVDTADKDQLKDFIYNMLHDIEDKTEDKSDDDSKEAEDADGKEDAADATDTDDSKEDKSDDEKDSEDKSDDKDEDKSESDDNKDDSDDKKDSYDEVDDDDLADLDIEVTEDDSKEDDSDNKDKDDSEEDKSDDKSEDDDKDDSDDEKDSEDKDDDDDLADTEIELTDDEVDEDEDANEDDDIEDALGEPLDDDGIDADITVDGDTENNGKIFDDLKKEDDVQKAIELIRSRVANAEETFIRNNAEDKKKIDELLNKISSNVKTVEELDGKNDAKAEVAKEAATIAKRQINDIKSSNKSLTVFEKMSRILAENIIKNPQAKEMYIEESGALDTYLVMESAKVMYGFLETLNTLQLENVNEEYIGKIIADMKKDR